MLITINWPMALGLLICYYFLRYLYRCYQRWIYGARSIFYPYGEFTYFSRRNAWEEGYLQGRASIVDEFDLEDRCTDLEVLGYLRKIRRQRP